MRFISTCGMTILSLSDSTTSDEYLAPLPKLPRDDGGPVFALAVKLSELRHFTLEEWAATLADELKTAENRGEPDDGTHCYQHWLAALERLVVEKGLTNWEAIGERKEAWTEAYLRTPHGKPVEPNGNDHEHRHG